MTAMFFPCSRAPKATPDSTGIKSPKVEIGATTLRYSMSPKWEEASRPLVGEPDLAMYCIMMSRGENPAPAALLDSESSGRAIRLYEERKPKRTSTPPVPAQSKRRRQPSLACRDFPE